MQWQSLFKKPLSLKLYLLTVYSLFFAVFLLSNSADAATYTVCSAGCDYTTVTDAIAGGANGDTINVTGTISDGVDIGGMMMLSVTKEVTIACSPAVELQGVEQVRIFSSNVTLSGCTLSQVSCSSDDNAVIYTDLPVSNVSISDNTITNFGQGIITGNFAANENITIDNNTVTNVCGPTGISLNGMGTVSNNTVEVESAVAVNAIIATGIDPAPGVSPTINITNNTINSSVTSDSIQVVGLSFSEYSGEADVNITGNVVNTSGTSNYLSTGIYGTGDSGSNANGAAVTIQNNIIANAMTGVDLEEGTHQNFTINNNTFFFGNTPAGTEKAFAISGAGEILDTVSFRNNIILGYLTGLIVESETTNTNIQNLTEDYNSYWGVTSDQEVMGSDAGGIMSLGTNSFVNTNPGLTDASSGDFSLLAFSAMIGAGHDSSDIGGVDYTGARTTTINIGSGQDFTSIQEGLNHASPTGADTISIAAGTYSETSSIAIADKSFNMSGAGEGVTIIDASGLNYGLSFNNVDSSTFSNFTVTGDSSTLAGIYASNGADGNTFSNITITGITNDTFDGDIPQTGGFLIDGSSSNTLTSVTITGGENGVAFTGTSASNAVNSSTVDTNTFDFYSTGSGTNSISGVTYTTFRVTGDGELTGTNSAPTGIVNSATQATDGTGYVTLSIEVDDPDDDDVRAKVEYETDSDWQCDGPWSNATIRGVAASADFGTPSIGIDTYQIGTTTAISTASGSNTVSFIWDSAADLPTANGSQCLRLTINDSSSDQDTPDTERKTIDNTAPSGLSTLTASPTTTSASLSWDSITETNFDHYEVWYGTVQADVENRTGTATEWDNDDDSNLAISTRSLTTITGLSESTTYYFKVWAVDSYGNEGTLTVVRADTTSTAIAGQGSPTVLTTLSGSSSSSTSTTRPPSTETNEETRTTEEETRTTEEETIRAEEVTVIPTITEEERRRQLEALEVATGTVGTAIKKVVESQPSQDREIRQGLNNQEVETAIKAYEERTALPTKEEDRIEDQRVKEDIILGSMLKNEEVSIDDIQKAQNIIEKNIEVSISNAINKAKDEGGMGVLLNLGKKQTLEVNAFSELKIVIKSQYSPDELEKLKLETQEEGKTLVAIDERSDLDSDFISDLYQIGHNLPLFNNNPDEDDYTNIEEIYLGLDPRVADEVGETPRVTNLENTKTGSRPSIRLSGTANDEVDVVLIKKEEREKLAKAKAQMGYASVILADTLNSDIAQISLGKVIIDERNKGELTPKEDLEDGEYYIIAAGKAGIGAISSFTVDSLSVPAQPQLISYEEENGIIKGKAEPGEIIFVTWKSRIFSSIVISDASEGEFELELPEDLEDGNHEVLVYLYQEKGTLLSSVTNLLFNR